MRWFLEFCNIIPCFVLRSISIVTSLDSKLKKGKPARFGTSAAEEKTAMHENSR